jgi:hypothetical protein
MGLAVGLVVGLGVAFLAMGRSEGPDHGDRGPSDRDRLVSAWARSQRATYTLEGTFRRTSHGRRVVDDPLVVVQRPPDRIALGYGSWDGVVGGRSVHCLRTGRHGPYHGCVDGGPADLATEDRDDLAQLRRMTAGRSPAYRVTALDGSCFLLRAAEDRLPTPYGRRARYCFDRETGAMTRTRVEHDDAVDEVTVSSVAAVVSTVDLPPSA